MIRSILRRAGILTLSILLIGPTALAQSQTERVDDEVPTDEIEQVAEVLLQIEDVRQKYQAKIQEADTEEKIRSYQRQMKLEIDRAVQDVDGLTAERYKEITRAAQSDAQLKQQILSLVEEKRNNRKAR